MGLGISSIQSILELWEKGYIEKKKIIEMGSQELHLKLADFEELVLMAGVKNYHRESFKNLNHWPKYPRCPAKLFYEMLCVEQYDCIDLNMEHSAIGLDYNLPLKDTSLYSKYDIVSDYGSCEHAFNIGEAYRTMHRLCKPNGFIIIEQSLWKGNGYYLFDKSFFEGLAAANNYKVLLHSYVICLRTQTKSGSNLQFHIPMNQDLLDTIDFTKVSSIAVTGVLQKQNNDDFKFPYQGSYLSRLNGNFGYNRIYLQDPQSYYYIPCTELGGISTKKLVKELAKRIVKNPRIRSFLKK